jgi:hypothetical protein
MNWNVNRVDVRESNGKIKYVICVVGRNIFVYIFRIKAQMNRKLPKL